MKKKLPFILFCIILPFIYFISYELLGFSVPCLFHKITHLYCPGCGVTRLLFSLLKLDFYQAFRYNPLIFVVLICYVIYKLINLKYHFKLPKYTVYIVLLVVILFGVLRNIDTFSFLKPTRIN